MKLSFNSMDELRAFLAEIDGEGSEDTTENTGTKRKRRTKAEMEADKAAAAQAPQGTNGFAPPPSAAPPASGFTAPPVTTFTPPPSAAPAAPDVNPLVPQIIEKTETAMKAGHPVDNVVGWFRQALGAEAAQANWDQIKAAHLPKASEATLKTIAAQMGVAA